MDGPRAGSTPCWITSERWRGTGASHLEINTMRAGFESVDDHLAALSKIADALDLTRTGRQ